MRRVFIAGLIAIISGCGMDEKKIFLHLKPVSYKININSADMLRVEVLTDSESESFSHSITEGNYFEFKGKWNEEISISVEGIKGSDSIFFGLSAPFYPQEAKEEIYIPLGINDEFVKIQEFPEIVPLQICGAKNKFVVIGNNGVFLIDLLSFKIKKIYDRIEDSHGCAFVSDGILVGGKGNLLFLKGGEQREYEIEGLEKYAIFSAEKYAVIAGGISDGKKTAESYLFKDGELKKWKSMNSPRAGHIAIPLQNNDFLIAGDGEPEVWRNAKMDFESFFISDSVGDVSTGVFVENRIFFIKKDTGEILELNIEERKLNSSGVFNGTNGAGDGKNGMIVNDEGDVLILPDLKTIHIKEIESSPNKIYSTRGIYIIVSKTGFYIYMKK